jgi:hypothetical protein
LFYDGFDGSSIDTSKWTGDTASASVSGGIMTFLSSNSDKSIFSVNNYSIGARVKSLIEYPEADSTGHHDGETGVRTNNAWTNYCRIYYYDKAYWFTENRAGGTTDQKLTSSALFQTYGLFEVNWITNSAKYYVNSANIYSSTTYVPTTAIPVYFRSYSTAGYTSNTKVDWVFVSSFVSPEPTHGAWGSEETPSVSGNCYISNMSDTNKIYARYQYYNCIGNYTDINGYADINYAEFRIKASTTIKLQLRFVQANNSFSIVTDSSKWYFYSAGSSYSKSGNTLNVDWQVKALWGADTDTNDNIEMYIINNEGGSNTTITQSNYVNIVTNIVPSGFTINSARGNKGATITFTGQIVYAGSALYPPNSEFTSMNIHNPVHIIMGTNSSVNNGYFTISFTSLNSIASTDYHCYIIMSDASWSLSMGEKVTPTQTYISDDILITGIYNNNSRMDINKYTLLTVTAQLEYDAHCVGGGVGDTMTLNGLSMSWVGASNNWQVTDTSSTVQQKTYNTCTGYEATYSITTINMNGKSTSVTWDSLIIAFSANNTRPNLNETVDIIWSVKRVYDNSFSNNFNIAVLVNGSAFYSGTANSQTDMSSFIVTHTYICSSITDNTYGLTVFSGNSVIVYWGIPIINGTANLVITFTANSTSPYTDELIMVTLHIIRTNDNTTINNFNANITRNGIQVLTDTPYSNYIDSSVNETTYLYNCTGIVDNDYMYTTYAVAPLTVYWFPSASVTLDTITILIVNMIAIILGCLSIKVPFLGFISIFFTIVNVIYVIPTLTNMLLLGFCFMSAFIGVIVPVLVYFDIMTHRG